MEDMKEKCEPLANHASMVILVTSLSLCFREKSIYLVGNYVFESPQAVRNNPTQLDLPDINQPHRVAVRNNPTQLDLPDINRPHRVPLVIQNSTQSMQVEPTPFTIFFPSTVMVSNNHDSHKTGKFTFANT
ncbi:hypothetical protein LguiB_021481 [Lonicera macranthoides]